MTDETFTPLHDVPPGSIGWRGSRDYILSPEDFPKVEDLVIEDGKPVDNVFVEKQYRLLTEPLYSSWVPPNGPFWALANVGLFYQNGQPGLAPDVMLSLGVPASRDLLQRENRSYLMWIVGKPPDVVIEFVSDRRGGEDTDKMEVYARLRVTYYIIDDPFDRLHQGPLRVSVGTTERMSQSSQRGCRASDWD